MTISVLRGGLGERAVAAALVLLALGATALVGQEVPSRLTLEEAITLARGNNPAFLAVENDAGPAAWDVRSAYAAFLPTASLNSSATWQEAGAQRFGTVDLGTAETDWYQSYYGLNFSWTLNGSTVFGLPAARAGREAVEAGIDAARFDLGSRVALNYMAVLRARDGVEVAQRQLSRTEQNLQIVRTRVASGAAAGTDGKQAEVDLGRSEVDVIQAQRLFRATMALLGEQLGVTVAGSTELSSEFTVFQPTWDREELISGALDAHPSLRSFAAREHAASATAKQAAGQYFPSLSVTSGLRGTSQEAINRGYVVGQSENYWAGQAAGCEFNNTLINNIPDLGGTIRDCGQYAFTPERQQDALTANDVFPFGFTKLPVYVTFQLSIPIFTGLSRQRQLSQASNAADDARYNLRAEELRLRTAVTQAFDNLTGAYEVVQLEARNRTLAEEQLQMQQRRYALGAAALLELMDAQTTISTADQAYLNAVYDFHWNLIRLEAATGRSLRPTQG